MAQEHDNENEYHVRSGKRQRMQKYKNKSKRLFKQGEVKEEHDASVAHRDRERTAIHSNPAFNPDILARKKEKVNAKGLANKTIDALRYTSTLLVNPKLSLKGTATRTTASQLSRVQHPYVSHGEDVNFLKAQGNLSHPDESTQGADTLLPESDDILDELESRRERMRVAWTTSRHVNRVRVVPKEHVQYPPKSIFQETDPDGTVIRFNWSHWLGHMIIHYTQDFCVQYIDDFDELPFDVDLLRSHIERLVMASESWQAWLMKVRRVYRWDDPVETGTWFALYLFLWYTQYVMAFLYSYILYSVLRNYWFPSSAHKLKASIERSSERGATASRFGELLDKHGRDEWLKPMITGVGPSLQLQIGDVANLLEVLSNFYGWKSPKQTASSLFFFFTCLLVCLCADMKFCMKIVWFVVGGAFFLCWPLSSHYPKYRYLVSPIKWVLWNIPTNAEWSFQYLRRHAQLRREEIIEQRVEDKLGNGALNVVPDDYTNCQSIPDSYMDCSISSNDPEERLEASDLDSTSETDDDWHSVSSTHSVLGGSDIVSLRCEYKTKIGRLIIYSGGLRFVQSFPKKELWRKSFLEIKEMKKLEASAMTKLVSLEKLQIDLIDGQASVVLALTDRDEAFNTVIGFSGLQWQALQTASSMSSRGLSG
ncbi:MAG: hypothetical protein M1833_000364 [Piccolia ochrophora]|nr:MAG: hypothetical protein M1833_000364 [Piccolia ochrophora]